MNKTKQMPLKELRLAMGKTQKEIADLLSTKQEQISRLEMSKDMRLSTLIKYFRAMELKLKLIVETKDHEIIEIVGLNQIEGDKNG